MTRSEEAAANVSAILVDHHIAANRGDQTALRYGDRRYTYNDLAALTNRAGNLLRRSGVGREDRVLLLLPPSPAFFGSLFGALKIGAAPVVLEGAAESAAIRTCLERATPMVAIVEQGRVREVESAAGGHGVKIMVVGADSGSHPSFVEALREMPSSLAHEKVEDSALALVICSLDEVARVSHGELAAALSGEAPGAGTVGTWSLLPLLKEFAAGGEVSIAR